MKTQGPPRSSKGQGKAVGKNAPKADAPMARFREAAAKVLTTPKNNIDAAERAEKKKS